jgi:DNA processing protein
METLCLAHYLQQQLLNQKAAALTYQLEMDLLRGPMEDRIHFLESRIGSRGIADRVRWLQTLKSQGVCFCYPGHEDYPPAFQRMLYPPFLISYIGRPVWKDTLGLAVVGSRDVSVHSLQWMEKNISTWLQRNSVYIVSGGARGVDQKAHLLCLQNQRPTIAVLPSGLGDIYPSSLQSWVSEILRSGGCLVSEYDYNQAMRKHFFHARNRLISALGVCSLVVQAERRSGTLITARQTLEQGKAVLVVPSHPLDIAHQGGLDLIIEGATPVRDAQDLDQFFSSESSAPELVIQSLGKVMSIIH